MRTSQIDIAWTEFSETLTLHVRWQSSREGTANRRLNMRANTDKEAETIYAQGDNTRVMEAIKDMST